jgi:hypothetical protein
MSSRPQFNPYLVLEDGDMSGNLLSEVTIIQKLSLISYSIVWSGTAPVGTITVEVSNDYTQNADGSVRNAGTWSTMPLSAPTGISGNSDAGFIDIYASAGFATRVRYTRASGTGTMNITAAGKVA